MKKIEAIFKPFKLDEIKGVLAKERIPRVSLVEVKGAGCHQIRIKQYRGATYSEDASEVSLAMVVEDDEADRIAQILVTRYFVPASSATVKSRLCQSKD